MCEPDDSTFLAQSESLLYRATDLTFEGLNFLEQASLVFRFCASKYFDWNHLPSGPYWVKTVNTVLTGRIDKILAIYRDEAFVEIKFAVTLPDFEFDYRYSYPKNATAKLKIFNLVLQISSKNLDNKNTKDFSPEEVEVSVWIKATTDAVFDDVNSDLYCIDTVIQLSDGKFVGDG